MYSSTCMRSGKDRGLNVLRVRNVHSEREGLSGLASMV